MADHVFYCVVPYDLQVLGYDRADFRRAGHRCFVNFEIGPNGPQEFNCLEATVQEARRAIAEAVRQLPSGGTVLVVEVKMNRGALFGADGLFIPADIHMLPFDDGENFNRNYARRNEWCPSSADADWPLVEHTARFDRLDKYDN